MSLVGPILEYGVSCWDLNRDGQINALDPMQKKADKFANYTNDSGWEILAQRRKIARICALFEANTVEWASTSIGDRLKGPCCMSRDDRDRKIRARK